eukprot:8085349-Alexandrium_andersonii.AAC.1
MNSWAFLARKWAEWKESGRFALLETNALMSLRQIFNEEGHRGKLLTMAAEEMLSTRDTMGRCWHAFPQIAAAGVGEAAEEEVLDLAATQPMEVDHQSCNLRNTPHGSSHHDLAEGEQRWVKEERE